MVGRDVAQAFAASDQARSGSLKRWALPAALGLLFAAQCLWFVGTQSFTCDEPDHIYAGQQAWRRGELTYKNETPLLPRLLLALPVLGEKWRIDPEGWRIRSIEPSAEAMAWRTRLVNVALGLLLACVLWRAVGSWFSESAANLALALLAFSPPLIAHCSVATADGGTALFIFAAAVQFVRWKRDPSIVQTIVLGVLLGGMLVMKYSTPPLFVLMVVLALVSAPPGFSIRPAQWNWARAGILVLIAPLVVWAVYFFHVATVQVRLGEGRVTVLMPGESESPVSKSISPLSVDVPLPAAEYFAGLASVARHNRAGHPSYFLGQVSATGGWPTYFPVAIALKWPTVVLLLALAGGGMVAARRLSLPRGLGAVLSVPMLLLGMAVLSRFNIGDRHVLPLYPFLLVLAGGALGLLWQRRGGRTVALLAVLLSAADGLRYAPDYWSHFNVLVPRHAGYKLLSDSALDLGQGLLALRAYQHAHPEETIHLAFVGRVAPSVYGLRVQNLEEGQRPTGTVVVSATQLAGQLLNDPRAFDWVWQHPLKAVLNHSMYVFDVRSERQKP